MIFNRKGARRRNRKERIGGAEVRREVGFTAKGRGGGAEDAINLAILATSLRTLRLPFTTKLEPHFTPYFLLSQSFNSFWSKLKNTGVSTSSLCVALECH